MKKIMRVFLALTFLLGLGLNSAGVQAFTNEQKLPTLKAASTTASTFDVIMTNPHNEGTDVPINSRLSVTFMYPIQWVNGSSGVTLHKVGVKDSIPGTAIIKNNTITFIPKKNLASSSNYILEIQEKSVKRTDDASQQNAYYSFIFKTGTSEAPLVTEVSPYEMQQGVGSQPSIKITFDRDIKASKGTLSLIDENNRSISGKVTVSTKTVTFQPNSALTKNTYFYLLIPAGLVKDSKGKANYDYVSVFLTGNSGPDQSEANRYTVVEDQSIKLTLSGGKTPYKAVSSNTKIATVKVSSKTIEIKGINEGTATITLTDNNKKTVKLTIEVKSDTIPF